MVRRAISQPLAQRLLKVVRILIEERLDLLPVVLL